MFNVKVTIFDNSKFYNYLKKFFLEQISKFDIQNIKNLIKGFKIEKL